MMRSFIISLTIICAISWTGFALKCLECLKVNSDTCDGVSVDCPNSVGCLVVSEFYQTYDTVYHSVTKGCNPGLPCNTLNYLSEFSSKKIKVYVQCCTGDNCNTDNYQMPPEQKEHNGMTCPACYGDGMKECISDRTVKCWNKEDVCLDFIGRYKEPDNSIQENNLKGCASPLVCHLGFGALVGVKEIQTDRLECSG